MSTHKPWSPKDDIKCRLGVTSQISSYSYEFDSISILHCNNQYKPPAGGTITELSTIVTEKGIFGTNGMQICNAQMAWVCSI